MFSATMQHTQILKNHHFYHSFSSPFFSFLLIFISFLLLFFASSFVISFSSPLSPPPPPLSLSPPAATPVSLKVRVRDFCYSLTVIFLLYNNVCNVCIVFSITIINIKFKCGLGLLDELYYLVPRPNHLAICLVIINVI